MTGKTLTKTLAKGIISAILLTTAGWLLTETVYGSYLTYHNHLEQERGQFANLAHGKLFGFDAVTKDWRSTRASILTTRIFLALFYLGCGLVAIWGGAVLWNSWRTFLGSVLVVLSTAYFFEIADRTWPLSYPYISCQLKCEVFGSIYCGAGIILIVYDMYRRRRASRHHKSVEEKE